MKIISLFVLVSVVMMSYTVQADDVSRSDYQSEILEALNQYGVDFDDCFPELPSDFPSLPNEYLELDERIGELQVGKWYHRQIPYLHIQIDEIFFTLKTEMSYFAIRVSYLFNEEESEFIIYEVNFYETTEGIKSDLWHSKTLLYGNSEEWIEKN